MAVLLDVFSRRGEDGGRGIDGNMSTAELGHGSDREREAMGRYEAARVRQRGREGSYASPG